MNDNHIHDILYIRYMDDNFTDQFIYTRAKRTVSKKIQEGFDLTSLTSSDLMTTFYDYQYIRSLIYYYNKFTISYRVFRVFFYNFKNWKFQVATLFIYFLL